VILLRFLETGEIQRIGSDRPHTRVNVRLITATNRDLSKEIVAGTFREDLYFRLNVIRVHVPPLRERAEDVPLLVDYYLGVFCEQHRLPRPEIAPATMEVLKHHQWPGNVRELKNVVERMVLRAGSGMVQVADLPPHNFQSARIAAAAPAGAAPAAAAVPAVQPQVEAMMARMLQEGESFWTVVYPPFIGRDLTRAELQSIIRLGLEATNGNYRLLVQLFNMPLEDYKRFLGFLRKHDCHLPFQRFRTVPARLRPPTGAAAGAMATAG
jgi:transcriptional regulator with AAA-type ATPase domain